jgi:drug/metabolite transporter (DMT)-like permease
MPKFNPWSHVSLVIACLHFQLDYHRLIAVGWTGIVTTVVAIYLQGVALGVATATEAALTFASEPVWASLFGAWLLKEQLNATTYVGGSIILLGCLLGSLGSLLEPTKVDPPLEKNE